MTAITKPELHGAQADAPPARSPRARLIWTSAGLFLAMAMVAGIALTVVGSVAYQRLAPRLRVFTTPITGVTVEVSRGDVTIERGAGVGAVVATSGIHGLTFPTDEERVVGSRLVIRSTCGSVPFNDRCARHYVLHVPARVDVIIESGQGNVSVTGTDRSVSAHSDQGDVIIAGGSGSLQASSSQGGVTISRSAATSVSAHSDQGDVAVDLITSPNRVTASSDQGGVTVQLPKGPNPYHVHASSDQGNVSDTVASNPASSRVVNASSAQGDVTVGYRPG